MRCKNIQRLILDMSGEDRIVGPADSVKRHAAKCPKCSRFLAELNRLRAGLENRPLPSIPRNLDVRTKEKCLAALSPSGKPGDETSAETPPSPLPKLVWAALFAITALTLVVMAPLIKNFRADEPVTLQAAAMFALMIQNAVMLLFTPILMRKVRRGFFPSTLDGK